MKKIIFLFVMMVLACITSIAQNVGIGTPAPEQKLHVVDTFDVADGSSGAFINVQNATLFAPTGTLSGIRFRLDGVNAGANARYKGGILFEKSSSFGVGKLHFLTNNLGNNNSITTADARMTIASDGKVGIGNSDPSLSQLEIIGPANLSHLISHHGPGESGLSLSVPLGFSPTIGFNLYYANAFRYMEAGYGAVIQYSPSSGTLFFNTSQTQGIEGGTAFFNSNSVAIDSNGYMGIGTSAPKAKLHVNSSMVIGSSATLPATGYLLSVNGKIISEEVKVQLDADWPDYVFGKNYRLRPLAEVEKFITANNHLPDIPSAKQVATEGLLLGDMQKRVMEKVEELTLYIIQLNKENQQLKQEMGELRKLIEKK
jgi:hypothetical protein